MSKIQALQRELEKANAEFENAVENDLPTAGATLDRVTELEGLIAAELSTPASGAAPQISAAAIGLEPVVRPTEALTMGSSNASLTISKGQLGIGPFEPTLAQLSAAQINALLVPVADTDDLFALVVPGTSVISAENRLHLTQRGDLKRAARGLAIAAAGGVDLDAQLIRSNSGREYTIEAGVCLEIQTQSQPDFSGNVATLEKRVPCKGHLAYNKVGDSFVPTGEEHLRCAHQWALMFALGYFVTASKGTFLEVARTEIGSRVGDAAARAEAKAVIDGWVENRETRTEVRTVFAKAIAHEKNLGNAGPDGLLAARAEIAEFVLPSGKTVAQAVIDLKGRMFALKVQLPMGGDGTMEVTTRTVKTMSDLASAVAPHFAVARQNAGTLKVLELIAR